MKVQNCTESTFQVKQKCCDSCHKKRRYDKFGYATSHTFYLKHFYLNCGIKGKRMNNCLLL